jgi:hypothetical protein|nr:MAG TPA: hypothetical protein [Caudoviricetes sp.]
MKCRIKGCYKKAISGTCFCEKHDASVRIKAIKILGQINETNKDKQ